MRQPLWIRLASFGFVLSSLAQSAPLGREILEAIPRKYDIEDPALSSARAELEELVDQCGPGVVRGAKSATGSRLRNRCAFHVKLDDWFFRPLHDKTGLLPDAHWAYRDHVTWYEPREAPVPDNFDLRDLMKNGEPEIRTQKCGDCWAWSTHHGLEIARAVHEQKVTDHSIQTVLSCSKKGSCNGGYMTAVDFLSHGLPYEPDFPYAASDKACKFSSSQISTGWDAKVMGTPYVGSSLDYSLARRQTDGSFREGTKVQSMMAAMHQWKSPLVVTVSAYSISGSGVYDSCSAINSGGNHMVAIVGWEMWNGKRVAHVWNSWGTSHGQDGVSRIVWECGDGRLNRGLGYSAKIVQYKAPCTPPDASQVYLKEILKGQSTVLGSPQGVGARCSWTPTDGLDDPTSCTPNARPDRSTEYHFTVENDCGKSSSMTLVHVWGASRRDGRQVVVTPFGEVETELPTRL